MIKPHDAIVNDAANWLQAFTTFETDEGRGKGFLRLRESSPGAGDWKAYTFFVRPAAFLRLLTHTYRLIHASTCAQTAFWEIKGHEEFAGHRRPLGAEHGLHASSDNWLDKRNKQQKFEDEDPAVLIVGGGQNGLMLAARLTVLGIKTLIVEKNPRIGDSWRRRYHSLCLHDPVWADHCTSYIHDLAHRRPTDRAFAFACTQSHTCSSPRVRSFSRLPDRYDL